VNETLGNRETVGVGQHDIEQYDLRPQRRDCGEGVAPVRRLAHDPEPASLEHPSRKAPEARVVVHDQHRPRHVRIVAS
jgi:hypothetical protein